MSNGLRMSNEDKQEEKLIENITAAPDLCLSGDHMIEGMQKPANEFATRKP